MRERALGSPNEVAMRNQRTIAVGLSLIFSVMAAHAQTYIFGRADFPVGTGPNGFAAGSDSPSSIAMGDFNGDGVQDVAIVNQGGNTVSVLLGKPDGTFAPQVIYATGIGPFAIVAGDFNGDGNLDLAITSAECISHDFSVPAVPTWSESCWAMATEHSCRPFPMLPATSRTQWLRGISEEMAGSIWKNKEKILN